MILSQVSWEYDQVMPFLQLVTPLVEGILAYVPYGLYPVDNGRS